MNKIREQIDLVIDEDMKDLIEKEESYNDSLYETWDSELGFFKEKYFENQQYYMPYYVCPLKPRTAMVHYVLCKKTNLQIDNGLLVSHRLYEGMESDVNVDSHIFTDSDYPEW